MNETEVFQLWKAVAGDDSAASWDEDAVFGFFQRFRPHGEGLAAALTPLPLGAQVLERVLRVYAATADGWQRDGGVDMYFVVRTPVPCARAELEDLARRQAGLWAEMAAEMGEDDLAGELEVRSVEMVPGSARPSPEAPDIGLFDLEGDWHESLDSLFPAAYDLREAFYSIACDYRIARHVTWPWYASSTDVDEPFAPYFELWRRGVEIHVPEPGRIVLGLRFPDAHA